MEIAVVILVVSVVILAICAVILWVVERILTGGKPRAKKPSDESPKTKEELDVELARIRAECEHLRNEAQSFWKYFSGSSDDPEKYRRDVNSFTSNAISAMKRVLDDENPKSSI